MLLYLPQIDPEPNQTRTKINPDPSTHWPFKVRRCPAHPGPCLSPPSAPCVCAVVHAAGHISRSDYLTGTWMDTKGWLPFGGKMRGKFGCPMASLAYRGSDSNTW